MDKYTDEQIKAAMSLCTEAKQSCKDCLLCDVGDSIDICRHELLCDALDLINRQEAEIDTLKRNLKFVRGTADRQRVEISNLNKAIDNYESCFKSIEQIKSEAIKEFAERLKKMPSVMNCEYEWIHIDIDNLVKEMVGESK